MSELTAFEKEVSENVIQLLDHEEDVTVESLLTIYDLRIGLDKKQYHLMYQKIYNTVLNIQEKCWNMWHDHIQTQAYRDKIEYKKYYTNDDDFWKDKYFIRIFDMGLFSEEQITESIPEVKVFKEWVEDLKSNKGIPFLISGRGNKSYRIPEFHDFCVYKFNNMNVTSLILNNQVRGFADDGLKLPQGVSIKELADATYTVRRALEYNPPRSEPEGK